MALMHGPYFVQQPLPLDPALAQEHVEFGRERLVPDVNQTGDDVADALAALGTDVRLAEHYPHGALRWSEEADKIGQ